MVSQASKRRGTSALARALDLLLLFSFGSPAKTLAELSRDAGIPKSTTHRLLQPFVEKGLVVREAGNYALGLKLFELGMIAARKMDIVRLGNPILDELTTATGETSVLAVLVGHNYERVPVGQRVSPHPLHYAVSLGRRQEPTVGSMGKAILSCLSDDELELFLRRIDLPAFTSRSITDKAEFLEEIRRTRLRGFAISDEEFIDGGRSVAAVIRDARGRPVGGISVVGPTVRVIDQKVLEFGELVAQAASRLSALLASGLGMENEVRS